MRTQLGVAEAHELHLELALLAAQPAHHDAAAGRHLRASVPTLSVTWQNYSCGQLLDWLHLASGTGSPVSLALAQPAIKNLLGDKHCTLLHLYHIMLMSFSLPDSMLLSPSIKTRSEANWSFSEQRHHVASKRAHSIMRILGV